MTDFYLTPAPTNHPGVQRFELAWGSLRGIASRVDAATLLAQGLTVALMLALFSALNLAVSGLAESHWFAAWVILWVAAFVGLALLAAPLAAWSRRRVAQWDEWKQSRADAQQWQEFKQAIALDPRIWADVCAAGGPQIGHRAF